MVILGVSGFEDRDGGGSAHPYAHTQPGSPRPSGSAGSPVPLRFFPLQLLGHDPAAALIVDGELVACAAEERFTRIKHGFNLAGRTVLPRRAMRYCLDEAGLDWKDVDYWAHYCHFSSEGVAFRLENVARHLGSTDREIVAEEYQRAYRNRVAPEVVRSQLERIAGVSIPEDCFIPVQHHLAHAAGAFHSSGFAESAWLVLDGYGETDSSTWGLGTAEGLRTTGSTPLPTSLGVLYQTISSYLGFRAFGDEYKVMGLSSYGDPRSYRSVFDELVQFRPDGAFDTTGLTQPGFDRLLTEHIGEIPQPGAFSCKAADVAAALQARVEQTVLHVVTHLRDRFGLDRLCISGGVGLNACANGAVVRSGLIDRTFVQPAASDDGASLGAATYVHHQLTGAQPAPIDHTYWGPSYDDERIRDALERASGLRWEKRCDVEQEAARLLADDRIVGWFQGRMEVGPRALGSRSILASPRSIETRDEINARVKGREPFRPFAPSVLDDNASAYFDLPDRTAAPFMIVTFQTRESVRGKIPGVVHVDGSARVQTVSKKDNPRYYRLLHQFAALTGLPVLLNTSFNRAGEPIVCSPDDAVRCFLESGLDALVIGDYVAVPENGAGGERR